MVSTTYKKFSVILLLFLFTGFSADVYAQYEIKSFKFKKKNRKSLVVPFKLVHNLIIIPLQINGSDTLQFILDTGVSTTIITGLPNGEELNLKYMKELELSGLGEGEAVKALYSTGNTLEIDGAIGYNHEILYLLDDVFHLSSSMGTYVHGLIGYDFFKNFVVEVNYPKELLVLHEPKRYRRKNWKKRFSGKQKGIVPIEIEKFKPYINASIEQENGDTVGVKLLVDSGASHALSIYDITNDKINVPNNTVHSFLGAGLSGDIFGEIGRVQKFNIAEYSFDKVVTSFPDEDGIQRALDYSDRNGSLGAEVLKRFRVIFNYPEGHIQLKPNSNFKKEFQYNMSGLEITTPMPGMPIYEISKVRNNSPAMAAGLAKGDQIIMINGVNATKYSLNDIVRLLHSKEGKKIKLFVQRYNQYYKAEFILDDSISLANQENSNTPN